MTEREPDVSPDGRQEQLAKLLRAREEMQAQLGNLDDEIRRLERAVEEPGNVPKSDFVQTVGRTGRRTGRRMRPVREVILDALDDTGWISYSRELILYCKARYGRDIAPTRFGTLGTDEVGAFRKKAEARAQATALKPGRRFTPTTTVYLCFGLTYDRYEPIKRLWGRSDWPLEWRIIAPTSGRIQHLKLTRRLCDLAIHVHETASDPEMMRIIAADHARDLPGVKVRRGEFDLELWRQVADDLLLELAPHDEKLRKESAQRLGQQPEFRQLFGLPDTIDGAELIHRERRELP